MAANNTNAPLLAMNPKPTHPFGDCEQNRTHPWRYNKTERTLLVAVMMVVMTRSGSKVGVWRQWGFGGGVTMMLMMVVGCSWWWYDCRGGCGGVEKQKQEEATSAALAEEFDKIQAKIDADHELAKKEIIGSRKSRGNKEQTTYKKSKSSSPEASHLVCQNHQDVMTDKKSKSFTRSI
ncbi:hypothetical protein Tco_1441031 [Tanacetum coccineum]